MAVDRGRRRPALRQRNPIARKPMLDSAWYTAAALSLLIFTLSFIPDKYRLLIAMVSLLAAVACFGIGYEKRNDTGANQPSLGVVSGKLQIVDDDSFYIKLGLKNTGSVTAIVDTEPAIYIQGALTLGAPAHSETQLAGNGGLTYVIIWGRGPHAGAVVRAKLPMRIIYRIDYHGQFGGPTYSICSDGRWDYELNGMAGHINAPCPEAQAGPNRRDWLTLALLIYGAVVLVWYVLFGLVGLKWKPAFWPWASPSIARAPHD
jgi:hypothetical protein